MQPVTRVRVAAAVAAALLAGTTTGWVTAPDEPPPTWELTAAAAPVTPSPSATPPAPTRTVSPQRPSERPTPRPQPPPDRVEIPAQRLSMPVLPVGVAADGQMALPQDPAVMGWYEYGPRPGEQTGATVLAAHRDMPGFGTGPAARLDDLRAGDTITVRSGSNVRRYRVVQVSRHTKTALDLDRLFTRSGPERLHVVTCSGPFDPATRSYEQNLLVVGIPDG